MSRFSYSGTAADALYKSNIRNRKQIEESARAAAASLEEHLTVSEKTDLAECFISAVQNKDEQAVFFILSLLKYCHYTKMFEWFLQGNADTCIYIQPSTDRAPLKAPRPWFSNFYHWKQEN